MVKLPKKDQGRSLLSGKYDTACFCLNNTYTFYHLSLNREFKTARMWILSVNREKKTARKFPGLQYVNQVKRDMKSDDYLFYVI